MKVTALVLVLVFAGREPATLGAAFTAELAQSERDSECAVPDVLEMDERTAAARLGQARLEVGTVTRREARQPRGTVIGQQPACGPRPESGRVNLVVSTGPRTADESEPQSGGGTGTSVGDVAVPIAIGVGAAVLAGILSRRDRDNLVEVPDLLNTSVDAATQTLSKSRLRLGEIARAESLTAPAGTVIEQSPAAGSRVPRDTAVNVRASSGRPMIEVPDVTELELREADARVTGAGLRLLPMDASPGETSNAIVESQVPAAGTRVVAGATVGVTLRAQLPAGAIDAPLADAQPAAPAIPSPPAPPVAAAPQAASPQAPPPAVPAVPAAAPPLVAPATPVAQPATPATDPADPPAGIPAAQVEAPAVLPAPPSTTLPLVVLLVSSWPWLWLLLLLAAAVILWKYARSPRTGKEPAPPPAAARVTFVPRLDAGRQAIVTIDARRSRTFDLALHHDAGIQRLQSTRIPSRIVRVGAVS